MEEQSFGIIPLKRKSARAHWEVLLVQLHAGHWGFPKGHTDETELPKETAERELLEETGLHVKCYLSEELLNETYFFRFQQKLIHKTVHYFIAEVTGEVTVQALEIADFKWVPLKKAEEYLTFKEGKRIIEKVQLMMDSIDA